MIVVLIFIALIFSSWLDKNWQSYISLSVLPYTVNRHLPFLFDGFFWGEGWRRFFFLWSNQREASDSLSNIDLFDRSKWIEHFLRSAETRQSGIEWNGRNAFFSNSKIENEDDHMFRPTIHSRRSVQKMCYNCSSEDAVCSANIWLATCKWLDFERYKRPEWYRCKYFLMNFKRIASGYLSFWFKNSMSSATK